MVDHPIRSAMIHRANFQVTLEFTEGRLHVEQSFIVRQHFLPSAALGGFIGVQ
jgi:hypothetical protein